MFQLSRGRRFIYVKPVRDLAEALHAAEPYRGRVSTVGIAVPTEEREETVLQLARWGALRVFFHMAWIRVWSKKTSWRRFSTFLKNGASFNLNLAAAEFGHPKRVVNFFWIKRRPGNYSLGASLNVETSIPGQSYRFCSAQIFLRPERQK